MAKKIDEVVETVTDNLTSVFWFMMWVFTIGFANLTFWQGVLAIFIWPYYIGSKLAW